MHLTGVELMVLGVMVCVHMQALGQTQQIEEMLQVLAGAWAGRAARRPSIYACNSAIGACARAGRLDDALRVCSNMVHPQTSLCATSS